MGSEGVCTFAPLLRGWRRLSWSDEPNFRQFRRDYALIGFSIRALKSCKY